MKPWCRFLRWGPHQSPLNGMGLVSHPSFQVADFLNKSICLFPSTLVSQTLTSELNLDLVPTPASNSVAIHSSVLAWRIPRTEEPGGLPFMGSQSVRHD